MKAGDTGFVASLASLSRVTALRMLAAAMGFAATYLVTVALGAEQAGLLYATLAWVFALAILANWGGAHLLLVDCASFRGAYRRRFAAALANRVIRNALARAAVLACLVLGAALVASAAGMRLPVIAWLLAAMLVFTVLLQLFAAAGKAVSNADLPVFLEFGVVPLLVLAALAAAAFLATGISIETIAWAYLAATAAACALLYLLVLRPIWHCVPAKRLSAARKRRSRDFGIAELSAFVAAQGALLLMPFLLPANDVGVFNLALRIVSTVGLPISALHALIVPRLARARADRDSADWAHAMRETRIAMAGGGLVFLVAVGTLGPMLLSSAGPEFSAATAPLLVMALFFAGGMALGPGSAILSVARREHITRNVALGSAIAALAALAPAILAFGLMGAAVVTGLSYFAQKLVLLHYELQVAGPGDAPGGRS